MVNIHKILSSFGMSMLLGACGGGGSGNTSTGNGTDITATNTQFSEATPATHNATRRLLAQTPTFISNGGSLIFLQSKTSPVFPSFGLYASFSTSSGNLEQVGAIIIDESSPATSTRYLCGPDYLAPYYPNDVTHNFPCTAASADINKKTLKTTQQKMWMIDELGVYVIGTNAKSIVVTADIQ